MTSMSRTNDDVTVLTWCAPNFGVPSKALWASTYCQMVVDMTEGSKSTWLFRNAWADATLINAGQGVITVIITLALWIYLCHWRFCGRDL